MTSIFVYEFLSGGGLLNDASACGLHQSLLSEGRAMVAALAADFVRSPGVQAVASLRDRRLGAWSLPGCNLISVADGAEHDEAFDRLAAEAGWTVVIAPEIGGALGQYCRRVEAVGGRLLGPSGALIELASDKHATAKFLGDAGVPVPQGVLVEAGVPWPRDFAYPAIWKPLDGAGSQGIIQAPSPDAPLLVPSRRLGRLERFCPGTPASIAFLCGPGGLRLVLPACRQRLSDDSRFRYLGGELPLPGALALRAAHLAEQAVAALPGAFGYLGIDLVLGEAVDGADDVVVEINPRLTTSYIGLRAAVEENLAHAMSCVASGIAPSSDLKVHRAVQFDADGSIRLTGDELSP